MIAPCGSPAERRGARLDPHARPVIRDEVVSAEVRDRRVVFDPGRRELFELRPDAASLWPLLTGESSVADLVQEMSVAADISRPTAKQLVDAILIPLVSAGLVTLERTWKAPR